LTTPINYGTILLVDREKQNLSQRGGDYIMANEDKVQAILAQLAEMGLSAGDHI